MNMGTACYEFVHVKMSGLGNVSRWSSLKLIGETYTLATLATHSGYIGVWVGTTRGYMGTYGLGVCPMVVWGVWWAYPGWGVGMVGGCRFGMGKWRAVGMARVLHVVENHAKTAATICPVLRCGGMAWVLVLETFAAHRGHARGVKCNAHIIGRVWAGRAFIGMACATANIVPAWHVLRGRGHAVGCGMAGWG